MNDKDKGNAHIALGGCSLLFGLLDLTKTSVTRPTGRWSVIFGPLFDAFGPSGPAMASVVIGIVLIFFGIVLRSKK